MAIKIFTKEYSQTLAKIFEIKQHFLNVFGGKLQVVDGITDNATFMELKVSDTTVVVQNYSTDENTAFGTGTANSNRFGTRKEIKSINKQIQYEAPLAIHEGVDRVTVNDNADQVIAERAGLHAEAWIEKVNAMLSKALSDAASETFTGELSNDNLIKIFNKAHKKLVNNKVNSALTKYAFVTPDVYAVLVDHPLTTPAKLSTANIEEQEVKKFKGFVIIELADEYFQTGEQIVFTVDNVGVAGVGIETYRLLDSEAFNGVAIQALAKYAKYIPDDNKKAVFKAKLTGGLL